MPTRGGTGPRPRIEGADDGERPQDCAGPAKHAVPGVRGGCGRPRGQQRERLVARHGSESRSNRVEAAAAPAGDAAAAPVSGRPEMTPRGWERGRRTPRHLSTPFRRWPARREQFLDADDAEHLVLHPATSLLAWPPRSPARGRRRLLPRPNAPGAGRGVGADLVAQLPRFQAHPEAGDPPRHQVQRGPPSARRRAQLSGRWAIESRTGRRRPGGRPRRGGARLHGSGPHRLVRPTTGSRGGGAPHRSLTGRQPIGSCARCEWGGRAWERAA